MTARDLAAYMEEKGQRAVPCDSTRQGVETVLELASPEDVVCICGSLYMIGEVRPILGRC